jgi:S1-C subfamily serine protease
VTAYGQGANAELRVAHGRICNIAGKLADSPYFIFAGNAGPGFSGGPVLDGDGRLIGITFAFVDRPKNRRLIFAYDMKRVAAEFQRKQPRKSKADGQGVSSYGACDRQP